MQINEGMKERKSLKLKGRETLFQEILFISVFGSFTLLFLHHWCHFLKNQSRIQYVSPSDSRSHIEMIHENDNVIIE